MFSPPDFRDFYESFLVAFKGRHKFFEFGVSLSSTRLVTLQCIFMDAEMCFMLGRLAGFECFLHLLKVVCSDCICIKKKRKAF